MDSEINVSKLHEIISTSNNENIFEDIANNAHFGFFIFSKFDCFSEEIEMLLNSNFNIKFIREKELSILCEFISEYNSFCEIFKMISCDDFIKYKETKNISFCISHYAESDTKGSLYDVYINNSDKTISTIYTTKFPIFEEAPLKNIRYYTLTYQYKSTT